MDDVAVSVHRYQGDAGAGEEHRHALNTANRLTQPGLDITAIITRGDLY